MVKAMEETKQSPPRPNPHQELISGMEMISEKIVSLGKRIDDLEKLLRDRRVIV